MKKNFEKSPVVSVIVPCRNEVEYIEGTIKCIVENDYPKDCIDIIIVDGMSDDGTREILEKLQLKYNFIRVENNERKVAPSAFNIGLQKMVGEYFVIIGAHSEIAKDFIKNSVECLQEKEEAWVAGGYIETVSRTFVGNAIAEVLKSPFGIGDAKFRTGNFEGYVETLAFGMHYSWVIDKVGYFDESFIRAQDTDFNTRIRQAGGKIWLSRSIKSVYYGRSSLDKLRRQYLQYGFWRMKFIKKHGKASALRQYVPLVFVLSIIFSLILSLFSVFGLYLLVLILFSYFSFLIFAVFDVAKRSKLKYALLAPVIIPIIHFSFGIGNIKGIWNFFIRRKTSFNPQTYKLTR
ncbi:glycosyltransferase family 2 protein [Sedimentisphaera salicampi]|uniref:glycosyltransferase family 2 protein n=1 Tax=Sedimentisphaera salicampi TaxID=1941349 RepID=UPI000B9C44D0|nr:glycosyltransferase family 2 protein [Sedimentisphaera salicampi]OXU15559.1 putative teichuronic acid biosynthesis glycosyltransferase TuaG [Sedimentisphaera salicampi]